MTAIHKRVILVGFIYVLKASFEARVPLPWYLPLTGFELAFPKFPNAGRLLSVPLGYKA